MKGKPGNINIDVFARVLIANFRTQREAFRQFLKSDPQCNLTIELTTQLYCAVREDSLLEPLGRMRLRTILQKSGEQRRLVRDDYQGDYDKYIDVLGVRE